MAKRKVKTHTVNGQKYHIEFADSIEGVTDDKKVPDKLECTILTGDDFRAFHSAYHESMEMAKMCDKCLHFSNGLPRTIDGARFLWRLGYRIQK